MGGCRAGQAVIKGAGGLCEPLCAPASGTMGALPNHYGVPAVQKAVCRRAGKGRNGQGVQGAAGVV